MYRYISLESCSQFDSLPLTYLTIQVRGAAHEPGAARSAPALRHRLPPHTAPGHGVALRSDPRLEFGDESGAWRLSSPSAKHGDARSPTLSSLPPSSRLSRPVLGAPRTQVSLVRDEANPEGDAWEPSLDFRVGTFLDADGEGAAKTYEACRLPQGHTCTSSLHLPVYTSAGRTWAALVHPTLAMNTRFDMD